MTFAAVHSESDLRDPPTCGSDSRDSRPQDPDAEGTAPSFPAYADSPAKSLRRCIVTGEIRPKKELIRFVAGPEGNVVPDLAGKLPGRGLWLLARRDVIHTAGARNAFARAAKVPLRPAPDLADQVERLLVLRCTELLGLARRAGMAVGGFEKVASRITGGAAGVLLQARDAAEDGRRKLRTMACARVPFVPVVECLDAKDLGRVFGDRPFVHVALDRGTLARRFCDEAARLDGLRAVPMGASEST
jgi:uncharacterized protein